MPLEPFHAATLAVLAAYRGRRRWRLAGPARSLRGSAGTGPECGPFLALLEDAPALALALPLRARIALDAAAAGVSTSPHFSAPLRAALVAALVPEENPDAACLAVPPLAPPAPAGAAGESAPPAGPGRDGRGVRGPLPAELPQLCGSL